MFVCAVPPVREKRNCGDLWERCVLLGDSPCRRHARGLQRSSYSARVLSLAFSGGLLGVGLSTSAPSKRGSRRDLWCRGSAGDYIGVMRQSNAQRHFASRTHRRVGGTRGGVVPRRCAVSFWLGHGERAGPWLTLAAKPGLLWLRRGTDAAVGIVGLTLAARATRLAEWRPRPCRAGSWPTLGHRVA